MVVAGGEKQKSDAEILRKRVVAIVAPRVPKEKVTLHRVRGVWLVELGPLEMGMKQKNVLMRRLVEEGINPMSFPVAAVKDDRGAGNSYVWQWGVLALLLAGGGVYFIRRFGETRRLGKRQKELEARQMRLEQEMKEGEKQHG